MGKAVGVQVGDLIEWHAPSVTNEYDTLCGLDAEDSKIDTHGLVQAGRGQKITCEQCKTIWEGVKALRLRSTDFT